MVFEGEYLRQQVTLGYAGTVHSVQGADAQTAYSVLSERATRDGVCRDEPR